jgi:thiamine-phosphate pyrophosphorylase
VPPAEVPAVYAIADAAALGGVEALPAAAAEMAAAGVRWIQLRAKLGPLARPSAGKPVPPLDDRRLYDLVAAAVDAVAGSGAALWLDDRADLAALFPVLGLHLGQRDLPPAAARRVVGGGVLLGLSTHDEAQLAAAAADPDVDVVAVGPVFATASKERPDPVVGLDGVRRARAVLDGEAAARGGARKPLVAIGGIGAAELPAVLAAGADSAAVLSAACRPPVGESCRRLLAAAGGGER